MENFEGCDKCENGYIKYKNIDGEVYIKKCDCLRKYTASKRSKFLFNRSNLPYYIVDYDINSYKGKTKDLILPKIHNFIKTFNYDHLFFYGDYGTQKSTIARYIGYQLIQKGYTVYYSLMQDITRLLQDADMDKEKREEVESILSVDCLILDEFSRDKVTIYKSEYQIPFITSFLKKRFEIIRKSNIIISNQDIFDFKKFSPTIGDLISREMDSDNMVKFEDVYENYKKEPKLKELYGDEDFNFDE
jgi:DNA replication protein DnaC